MSYPEYIIMDGVRVTIGEGGILRIGGRSVGMADLRPNMTHEQIRSEVRKRLRASGLTR